MDDALGGATYEVLLQFDGANLERLVSVAGDLEFLKSFTRDRLPTHTDVRLAAGVMRRLLIDNQLGMLMTQAAPKMKVPLIVEAVDIDSPLDAWPERWVRYAFAGGASLGQNAQHTGMLLGGIPKAEHEAYDSPEEFAAANPLPIAGTKRTVNLQTFLKMTSVGINTNELGLVRISRKTVLQYIANRKGGVHFDPRRDLVIKNVKKRRKEVAYYLLDHGLLRVGHLSGPEYEVASMAQALADAVWARQLIEAAEQAAPADFHGDPTEMKFWTGQREADGTGWATTRLEPQRPRTE